MSEITDLYKAKYGEPRPGTKVFIVTCQQKNGWQGFEQETSEIVPDGPEGQQAVPEAENSQEPHMHKGCTRDAEGTTTPVVSPFPGGAETEDGGGKAAGAGLEGRKVPGVEGDAPSLRGRGNLKTTEITLVRAGGARSLSRERLEIAR